jgi:hypothetical protein
VTSLTSASSAPRAGLVQQGVFFNQGAVPGSGGEARMNYRGAAPAVGGRADAGAASGVLTRFTVEQQGAILRVIDGDGSVYEGRFLDASASAGLAAGTGAESELAVSRVRSRSVAATRGGVPVSGVGAAASNVVAGVGAGQPFEVTGSNRTLRTRVIFTGFSQVASNAAETGNAPRTELADDRKALESVRSFSVNRAPAPIGTTLTIQRLQGQVQWGRTNRLGIDAVRVAP